jgi:hypothetical protein
MKPVEREMSSVVSDHLFDALRLLRAIRRALRRRKPSVLLPCRPQAMSKPSSARRVEWLPDMDSNHD